MQNNILDYLYKIIKEVPDKTAYSDGISNLSFREVYEQSCSIGTFLCNMQVYKEPVVVFMNKHPKMVVAFLGIVSGGDYYVPIDSEMPESRIELILKNVKARVMICDETTSQLANRFAYEGQVVLYDNISRTELNEKALRHIYNRAIDTDPIYIVFTSGSTGIPKGVTACHRSVIDYIEQLSELLKVDDQTVFGNQTPLYVDACLKELLPTLKVGATTYLIPKTLFSFPVKLVEYLNQYRINTICWVVSALSMVSSLGTFKVITPRYLRLVVFGSEVFPIKEFNKWKDILPNARFINLYGVTECTGMCCYYEVNRKFELDEKIPIGRAFKNTEIFLLDEKNEYVKDNSVGEICIRGTSLTHGYYNNMKKTQEVFVQNPLNPFYPELIYRTGDMGRYNAYGELEFITRKDFQIKHMGYRIELGEIEINANLIDEVNIAVCVYDKKKDKIVLYYSGSIDENDLLGVLKRKLPRYMVPNRINKKEVIPLTSNGKIDRIALEIF